MIFISDLKSKIPNFQSIQGFIHQIDFKVILMMDLRLITML